MDHHQGNDGSDYVRFVFGKRPRGAEDWKMDDALDAEFLFLAGGANCCTLIVLREQH